MNGSQKSEADIDTPLLHKVKDTPSRTAWDEDDDSAAERSITPGKVSSWDRETPSIDGGRQDDFSRCVSVLQTKSVTVTPSGHGKSVTVTNCHCMRRCFITDFLVLELLKVSLYPVCHCKQCHCNRLGLYPHNRAMLY